MFICKKTDAPVIVKIQKIGKAGRVHIVNSDVAVVAVLTLNIQSRYNVFRIELNSEGVEIRWFGKKCNRMPEAIWAHPKGYGDGWLLRKMGELIDPSVSVYQKTLHAVESVKNAEYEITLLDSCLAAPFGMQLYRWQEEKDEDLYFNLYNNKWNTNFPVWFSDDARFRFKIVKN